MIDDTGARALLSTVLHQAYKDYKKGDTCPGWCEYKDDCGSEKFNANQCDAKKFLHSAWCATICDGLDLNYSEYVTTCIKSHRLSRNTYKYVEGEIRDYKKNKQEVERLKSDIIHGSPVAQEVRGTSIGDTTASKAIKISTDRKIVVMERKVKAIGTVYNRLETNKKAVMTNMWERRYTSIGLAEKLGASERSVKRWKQQIVYLVAIELEYL